MKSNKIIGLGLLAVLAIASVIYMSEPAKAQTTSTTTSDYSTINLPTNNFVLNAGNTNYVLVNGWTNITSTTNITRTWDTSAAAFVNVTNVTSATNVTYPDFSAIGQDYVPIQIEVTNTGSINSNYVFGVVRSITGGYFDTNSVEWVTNVQNGTSRAVDATTFDMRGFNYGRVFAIRNTDTNYVAGNQMVVTFLGKSNKRNMRQ